MKKFLVFIFVLSIFNLQSYAISNNSLTVKTPFNDTKIEGGVININDTIYLPLTGVSEALGAVVYQNDNDNSFYIISRDGDVVFHKASSSSYTLNGTEYSLPFPSVTTTEVLIPSAMAEHIFGITVVYDNSGSYINRDMHTNHYNMLVSNLMRYCLCGDFYPENFSRYYSFYCNNPQMDAGVVINSVNIGLDKTKFTDAATVTDYNSRQVLVNKLNSLPANFTANNLVTVDRLYTKSAGTTHYLDKEAYYKYVDMYDAAAKEGLQLKIVSSHRTETYQRNLYNSYLRNYGENYAEKYSARPGYSEHQTGLAVDINSLYTTFENSKEYAWLKNHSYEFGFIERYEKGEEYITGYAYEPWHYRYVGCDAAKIIHEQDITYEEYYAVNIYKSDYSTDKDKTWLNVIQHYHLK